MLDRVKLMTQLQAVSDQVFLDFSPRNAVARASFQRISADPDFQSRIDRTQVPWLIPSWHGALDICHFYADRT